MSETSFQGAVEEQGAQALLAGLQSAGQFAFDYHPSSGRLRWPAASLGMLGHPAGTLDTLEQFLTRVAPGERLVVEAAFAEGESVVAPDGAPEFRFQDAAGTWRWLELRGTGYGSGDRRRVMGLLSDVTARRAREQRLQLCARILAAQREAVLVADEGGRIVWHNPAFAILAGAGGRDLSGRKLPEFDRDSAVRSIERHQEVRDAVARRGSWQGRIDLAREDGRIAVTEAVVTALEGEGSGLWLHVRRDVTERVELDEAAMGATRLEQQRLGLALHDGLGQELAGTSMLVRTLRNALGTGAEPDLALVRDVESLLQASVARCRELAQGVAPFVIDDDGIGAAIADLAARARRPGGASVRTTVCPRAAALTGNFGLQVFRLVQAALADALDREGVSAIDLEVWREEDDRLALAVVADGRTGPQPGPEARLFRHWLAQLGGSAEPLDASRGRSGLIAILPIPRDGADAPACRLARRA